MISGLSAREGTAFNDLDKLSDSGKPIDSTNTLNNSYLSTARQKLLQWCIKSSVCVPAVIISFGILFRYIRHAMAIDRRVDFLVYREGARIFIHGGKLYDLMPVLGQGHMWLPFLYPPIAGAFLAPFTLLSTERGQQIITVINLVLPLLIVAIVFSRLHVYKKLKSELLRYQYGSVALMGLWSWICVLTLYLWPITANQVWGQVNVILEFLVVVDLFIMTRRPQFQGILIGIAGAIKITPLGVIVYFIMRKQWRVVANTLITFAILTGVGCICSWNNTIIFFTQVSSHPENYIGIRFGANIGIEGIFSRLIISYSTIKLIWFFTATIVGICGLYLMKKYIDYHEYTIAALISIFVTLLISPVSWTYHWTWIGVLLLVIADFAYRMSSQILAIWVVVTYAFFCSKIEVHFPSLHHREQHWHWYQHYGVANYALLIIILFIVLAYYGHKIPKIHQNFEPANSDYR